MPLAMEGELPRVSIHSKTISSPVISLVIRSRSASRGSFNSVKTDTRFKGGSLEIELCGMA